MTRDEINKYRDKLEQQHKEKSTEIDTKVSLIIIGSLGFFLTINEKFIGLKDATWKFFLITSVLLLLSSFVFYLILCHLTTTYDGDLIKFIDDDFQVETNQSDIELHEKWQQHASTLSKFRTSVYITLAAGIICQLVFFLHNVMNAESKTKEEEKPIKIEVVTKDSSMKNIIINIDSVIIKSEQYHAKKIIEKSGN
jgi:hypothetical protein